MNNSIPITESLYEKSKPIDQLSNENAIQLFLKEQIESVISINSNIKTISEIIESCTKHLIRNSKGRIVYCGADPLVELVSKMEQNFILLWMAKKKISLFDCWKKPSFNRIC